MKTQHAIKIVIDTGGRVHMHDKNMKWYQTQEEPCPLVKQLLGNRKYGYFYAFIDTKNQIRILEEIAPRNF